MHRQFNGTFRVWNCEVQPVVVAGKIAGTSIAGTYQLTSMHSHHSDRADGLTRRSRPDQTDTHRPPQCSTVISQQSSVSIQVLHNDVRFSVTVKI